MRTRRETVEHPFATLKMRMGATHFLMKTLPKVATEMALHVLAYNLTRVMNIVGINRSSRQSGFEQRVTLRTPCDRSSRSAWLKVVPGLTPDSIPQNMLRRSRRRGPRPSAVVSGG